MNQIRLELRIKTDYEIIIEHISAIINTPNLRGELEDGLAGFLADGLGARNHLGVNLSILPEEKKIIPREMRNYFKEV